MNFLQNLKKRGFTPINSSGAECDLFNNNSHSDIEVISKNEYVWAALDIVSTAFAQGDLKLYKIIKGEKEEVKEHKVLDILANPNKIQDSYEFLKMCGLHYSIFGECIIHYDDILNTMTPIIPTTITNIIKDSKGHPIYYKYGSNTTVLAENIIHVKDVNPMSYTRGFKTFKTYKETVVSDNYAREWNRKGFEGTRIEWIMKHSASLEEKTKKNLQEGWRKMFNWKKRKSDVAVLDGGIELEKVSETPKDMDYVNLSDNSKQRILAANKVPKALLGQGEDSNRASIWGIEYIFAKYNTHPRQLAFAKKLNHSFLQQWFEKENLFFEFQSDIPVDIESEIKQQQADFNSGALTPNEIRAKRGLEPIEGGDEAYIPFSVLPLGEDRIPEPEPAEEPKGEKKSFTIRRKKSLISSFQRRMRKNENILKKQVVRVFKEQEKSVLQNISKSIEKDIEDPFNAIVWATVFQKTLFPPLLSLAQQEGQLALDETGIQYEFFKEDKRLLNAIEKQTFNFSQQINKTTLDELKKTLIEGVALGESEDKITQRVQKVFKKATTSRARMIASTEVHKSMNIAHHVGYQQAGVEKREWVSLKRIRADHIDVSGQIKAIDEPFLVGGEYLMYPGDPAGSPSNTILCGCRTIPVI